ncbi:mannosyltransferase [Tuber indicum]|nr:mannosyltransferase [Tuber indicum]
MSPKSPDPRVLRFSSTSLIFFTILSFRLLNALTIRTFFQPDEFFQSLEPAWKMVFDEGWLTWEWKNQLRSIAHPALFAAIYKSVNFISNLIGLQTSTRAEVLAVAPKVLQAVFAALGDYFTAKLAGKLFGGAAGWTSLWFSVGSAFHFFCSTRTFSNSLETSITTIALYYWPWPQLITKERGAKSVVVEGQIDRKELQLSLLFAAFACILRPTNVLIWSSLGLFLIYHSSSRDRVRIVTEVVTVGFTALVLNAVADHQYYGVWTFPPMKFLEFNLVQSLSVFYGSNPWHYYLSQGLPLLLTSFLPVTMYALYSFLSRSPMEHGTAAGFQLASTTVLVTSVYSQISHKEFRFIYPLLPILHVLSAAKFENLSWRTSTKKWVLIGMIVLNIPVAWYSTQVHQRGVVDVVEWLRKTGNADNPEKWNSVGFLMPCHSTGWRSSVMGDGEMWALGCEPPIGLSSEERLAYLDEADRFYASPTEFLETKFPTPPSTGRNPMKRMLEEKTHQWPDRLVFFGALEDIIKSYLGPDTEYEECKRFFNSHAHDDSRREGDVIIYCLRKGAAGGAGSFI